MNMCNRNKLGLLGRFCAPDQVYDFCFTEDLFPDVHSVFGTVFQDHLGVVGLKS